MFHLVLYNVFFSSYPNKSLGLLWKCSKDIISMFLLCLLLSYALRVTRTNWCELLAAFFQKKKNNLKKWTIPWTRSSADVYDVVYRYIKLGNSHLKGIFYILRLFPTKEKLMGVRLSFAVDLYSLLRTIFLCFQ